MNSYYDFKYVFPYYVYIYLFNLLIVKLSNNIFFFTGNIISDQYLGHDLELIPT